MSEGRPSCLLPAFAGGPGESRLALGPAGYTEMGVQRARFSKEEMEAMTAATTSGMRWEQGSLMLSWGKF